MFDHPADEYFGKRTLKIPVVGMHELYRQTLAEFAGIFDLPVGNADARYPAAKTLCGKSRKTAPPTANIQDMVFLCQLQLVANEFQFVFLGLIQLIAMLEITSGVLIIAIEKGEDDFARRIIVFLNDLFGFSATLTIVQVVKYDIQLRHQGNSHLLVQVSSENFEK